MRVGSAELPKEAEKIVRDGFSKSVIID
jgi:hypothetical protein